MAAIDNPLQQGLKQQLGTCAIVFDLTAAIDNPLQQGLKHRGLRGLHIDWVAAIDNPLQQGLKPMYRQDGNTPSTCRNRQSTTTGIETYFRTAGRSGSQRPQ